MRGLAPSSTTKRTFSPPLLGHRLRARLELVVVVRPAAEDGELVAEGVVGGAPVPLELDLHVLALVHLELQTDVLGHPVGDHVVAEAGGGIAEASVALGEGG